MRISHFFIDRPIFATVLSLIITIVGLIAQRSLPIAEYPEIAPPTVNITATYPGASAQVIADTVAAPIEQEVNGVDDMLYITSQSTGDGRTLDQRRLQTRHQHRSGPGARPEPRGRGRAAAARGRAAARRCPCAKPRPT